MLEYKTHGVCASKISYKIKDGIIDKVIFTDGCDGNLQGLSRLLEGMTPQEAINRLKGISCNNKGTSCPDQFAIALEEAIKSQRI
ncbi:MAG: TIGR03905 family TSCPD domain-containing protein [Clostridiales bacterium]|nr:TIGR03905 family TSCPD domain-containing protein [Clostridiales bacterium]